VAYTKTVFQNGGPPAISAEELNKMGDGILESISIATDARAWPKFDKVDPDQATWQENRPWERIDLPGDARFRVYNNGVKKQFNPFGSYTVRNGKIYPNGVVLYNAGVQNEPFTFVAYSAAPATVAWGSNDVQMSIGTGNGYYGGRIYTNAKIECDNFTQLKVTWEMTGTGTYKKAEMGLATATTDLANVVSIESSFYVPYVVSPQSSGNFALKTTTLDITGANGDYHIVVGIRDTNDYDFGTGTIRITKIELS
jgi:hypothetical protein